MNNFPSKETVARHRKAYPKGTCVEMVHMDDPYAEIAPGTRGVVDFVDDTGTTFCVWSTGGSLGVVYGVDSVRKVLEDDRHE